MESNVSQKPIQYEEFYSNRSPAYINKLSYTIQLDKNKAMKHHQLNISGIAIYFPYKPYECQIKFIEQVIDACNKKQYALLESPCGTGKTLSLLCSTLAWLKHQKENDINSFQEVKIFYITPTISQLSNLINELKKTCYIPQTAFLVSRDLLCINEKINQFREGKLNAQCRKVRKEKKCNYFFNADKQTNQDYGICDIEDLKNVSSSKRFCPYFYERNRVDMADIIFMTYNYAIQEQIQLNSNLSFQNSILIFDEAHNVEKICQEANSLKISTETIKYFHSNLCESLKLPFAQAHSYHSIIQSHLDLLDIVQQKLAKYNESFQDISFKRLSYDQVQQFFCYSSENAFFNNNDLFYDVVPLKNIASELEELDGEPSSLHEFASILELISRCYFDERFRKDFKFFIQKSKENVTTLFFQCMNPGLGFERLCASQPLTTILTSGTLQPFSMVQSELQCPLPIQFIGDHVIDQRQVHFSILTSSTRSNTILDFCFQNRNDTLIIAQLGYSIVDICNVTPGGILVFFPSFTFMNTVLLLWDDIKIIHKLRAIKKIFVDKGEREIISTYKESNQKEKMLVTVIRGSASEGIDFIDDEARGIIIVGIPYAPVNDMKVILKKEYLKEMQEEDQNSIKKLTPEEWYTMDAIRAVNQAIGRVIRHKNDYGAIVLIDQRYTKFINKKSFPGWLTGNLKSYEDHSIVQDLQNFFTRTPTGINNIPRKMDKMLSLCRQFITEKNEQIPKKGKCEKKTQSDISQIQIQSMYLKKEEDIEFQQNENAFSDKIFTLTGDFENQIIIENEIKSNGGKINPLLAKNTTYLLIGGSNFDNSKYQKALQMGIPILNVKEFYLLLKHYKNYNSLNSSK